MYRPYSLVLGIFGLAHLSELSVIYQMFSDLSRHGFCFCETLRGRVWPNTFLYFWQANIVLVQCSATWKMG